MKVKILSFCILLVLLVGVFNHPVDAKSSDVAELNYNMEIYLNNYKAVSGVFTYDSKSYLPVESICELLELDAYWEPDLTLKLYTSTKFRRSNSKNLLTVGFKTTQHPVPSYNYYDAYSANVKLFANDKMVNGNVITINGSFYLPLADVLHCLGVYYEWHETNAGIYIFKAFRNAAWWYTMEDVKNSEPLPLISEEYNQLLYESTVEGRPCKIAYYFNNDSKLVQAAYILEDFYNYSRKQLNQFLSMKYCLNRKFGTPYDDNQIWPNEILEKSSIAEETSLSVATNKVNFTTKWDYGNTNVSLGIEGDNQIVMITNIYTCTSN